MALSTKPIFIPQEPIQTTNTQTHNPFLLLKCFKLKIKAMPILRITNLLFILDKVFSCSHMIQKILSRSKEKKASRSALVAAGGQTIATRVCFARPWAHCRALSVSCEMRRQNTPGGRRKRRAVHTHACECRRARPLL
jgi:hypothetical protein